MTTKTIVLPFERGLDGSESAWAILGPDGQPQGPSGQRKGTALTADFPLGAILVEKAVGRHLAGWQGLRFHRVTHDGLAALHPGWYDPATEGKDIEAARKAVFADVTADIGPRTSEGRRRDHTSASQASRWLACPGSVRLCDEVAPRLPTSTVYADEGTAAHELAYDCLIFGTDALDLVGATTAVGIEIDAEMGEHVQLYLDTIRADAAAEGGDIQTEMSARIPVDGIVLHGTFDAAVWSPQTKTLRVYDLKFGKGIYVAATDNPQLRIYALGAARAVREKFGALVEFVEIVIVQPRRATRTGHGEDDEVEEDIFGADDRVRRERLSWATLHAWYEGTLVPGVHAFEAPHAPLVPSTDACRWCPAAYACPALAEASLSAAQEAFGGAALAAIEPTTTGAGDITPATPKKDAKTQMQSAVAKIDPARLARVLEVSPLLSLWLTVVEAHAHGLLESGENVPGFKLVQKIGNRVWKGAEEEIVAELVMQTPLDNHECYGEPKLLSPAQIEKALPKEHRAFVDTLTERPVRGTTMVPDSDKRPALVRDPLAGFTPQE